MTRSALLVLASLAAGFAAGYLIRGQAGLSSVPPDGPEQEVPIGKQATSAPAPQPPTAAAAALAPTPSGPGEGERPTEYITRLAATDPAAAIAWVREHAPRTQLWRVIGEQWAKHDPQAAFEWASALEHHEEKELAVTGVIGSLVRAGNIELTLEFAEKLPGGSIRERSFLAAVRELAKADAARALQLMEEHLNDSSTRHSAATAISRGFLDRGESDAFWAMVADRPFGEIRKKLMTTFLEAEAARDPRQGIDRLAEHVDLLDTGSIKTVVFRIVSKVSTGDVSPQDAIAWADRFPNETTRTEYLKSLGSRWGNRPGEYGDLLVASINESGLEPIKPLASGLLDRWMNDDQEEPFALIEQITDPAVRDSATLLAVAALASDNPSGAAARLEPWMASDHPEAAEASGRLMGRWISRDPQQASTWLAEQPPGPARDGAIVTLVDRTIRYDRDFEGAQAWLDEVSSPQTRQDLERRLAEAR